MDNNESNNQQQEAGEQQESQTIPEATTHPQSGLMFAVNQYSTNQMEEESDKPDTPPDDNDGDGAGDNTPPDDSGLENDGDEEDYSKLPQEELVNKFKEVNSLLKEKEEEISKIKTQSEATQDFDMLKENFVENYEKVREKYSLPSLDILKDFVSEGDAETKLKEWQETELKNEIEKKHGLVKGEFEYDPSEASVVGTPSYDWDEMTNNKKKEYVDSFKERQQKEVERAEQIVAQQKADIKWLGENLFEGEDKVQEKLNEMNDNIMKIAKGELSHDKHPYAVKNIVRGLFFDELVQKKVDTAIEELKAEYAKNQLYLPTDEMPTNVRRVNSRQEQNTAIVTDEQKKMSPMMRIVSQY